MTLEQIEARMRQLATIRQSAADAVAAIHQTAFAGEGRALTAEESASVEEQRGNVERIDTEVAGLEATATQLRAAEASAAPDGAASADAGGEQRAADTNAARGRAGAVVQREPRTYERHDMRTSYLRDLAAAQLGHGAIDPGEARERLTRHAAEVRTDLPAIEARQAAIRGGYATEIREGEGRNARSVEVRYEGGTEKRALDRVDGSGGEFVPPLWMVEDFIGVSRASRVVADRCNMMPLPGGTDSINIPKVATGSSTAAQTADNATISNTDMTTTSVQANVKTIAGQQDVPLQLLDQSPIAFDQVTFADLAEDHAVSTDTQVISGSNASGQVRGIRLIASVDTTAYTDASPTVAELYPKLADSANEVATNRLRPVTAIFMHPRRWYWMTAATDASSRPLVTMAIQGPQNALVAAMPGNPQAEGGPVGMTPFGPIWLDANIPTTLGGGTEDVIILTRPEELYLWESPIRTRAINGADADGLTVNFQLFNYVAFMPDRRPENTSLVGGTGLAAPTF